MGQKLVGTNETSQPAETPVKPIAWDEWFAQYQPVPSVPVADLSGVASDVEFFWACDHPIIRSVDEHHVWTLVSDEDDRWIVAGRQFVNRLDCFLTKQPWTAPELTVDRFDGDPPDRDDAGELIS